MDDVQRPKTTAAVNSQRRVYIYGFAQPRLPPEEDKGPTSYRMIYDKGSALAVADAIASRRQLMERAPLGFEHGNKNPNHDPSKGSSTIGSVLSTMLMDNDKLFMIGSIDEDSSPLAKSVANRLRSGEPLSLSMGTGIAEDASPDADKVRGRYTWEISVTDDPAFPGTNIYRHTDRFEELSDYIVRQGYMNRAEYISDLDKQWILKSAAAWNQPDKMVKNCFLDDKNNSIASTLLEPDQFQLFDSRPGYVAFSTVANRNGQLTTAAADRAMADSANPAAPAPASAPPVAANQTLPKMDTVPPAELAQPPAPTQPAATSNPLTNNSNPAPAQAAAPVASPPAPAAAPPSSPAQPPSQTDLLAVMNEALSKIAASGVASPELGSMFGLLAQQTLAVQKEMEELKKERLKEQEEKRVAEERRLAAEKAEAEKKAALEREAMFQQTNKQLQELERFFSSPQEKELVEKLLTDSLKTPLERSNAQLILANANRKAGIDAHERDLQMKNKQRQEQAAQEMASAFNRFLPNGEKSAPASFNNFSPAPSQSNTSSHPAASPPASNSNMTQHEQYQHWLRLQAQAQSQPGSSAPSESAPASSAPAPPQAKPQFGTRVVYAAASRNRAIFPSAPEPEVLDSKRVLEYIGLDKMKPEQYNNFAEFSDLVFAHSTYQSNLEEFKRHRSYTSVEQAAEPIFRHNDRLLKKHPNLLTDAAKRSNTSWADWVNLRNE